MPTSINQLIVNAQAYTNTAVWAMNLEFASGKTQQGYQAFASDKERLEFIDHHAEMAIKQLSEYLERRKQKQG